MALRGFRVYLSIGGKQVLRILYICKCCFGFRLQELDSIVIMFFRLNISVKVEIEGGVYKYGAIWNVLRV